MKTGGGVLKMVVLDYELNFFSCFFFFFLLNGVTFDYLSAKITPKETLRFIKVHEFWVLLLTPIFLSPSFCWSHFPPFDI